MGLRPHFLFASEEKYCMGKIMVSYLDSSKTLLKMMFDFIEACVSACICCLAIGFENGWGGRIRTKPLITIEFSTTYTAIQIKFIHRSNEPGSKFLEKKPNTRTLVRESVRGFFICGESYLRWLNTLGGWDFERVTK